MKGARFVLAASVAAGIGLTVQSTSAHAAAPSAAPSAASLQKELDTLTSQAKRLAEQLKNNKSGAVAAQNDAALTAADVAGLRGQLTLLEPRVAAAKADVSTMDKISGWFGGNSDIEEAEDLSDQLAEVRARADKARADAAAAAQRVTALTTAVTDVKVRTRTVTTEITSVKEQLKRHYTVGGVTVYGDDVAAKATRTALAQLGDPYVWGAAGPSSFDCSGLVTWSFDEAGRDGLPHFTGALWDSGKKVDRSELKPGDLVFFHADRHHVGIYVGAGKFVHAPSSGDVVKVTNLSERDNYNGAVRL